MDKNIIYEEKIFPKVEMLILGVVMAGVFALLVYQIFAEYPVSYWSHGLIPLILLIVVMYMFRKFNIKMTSDSIVVMYGFKHTILYKDIEDCYVDKTSVIRYGGWGIRMGRVNGKWRDVYNVIGYPRIVLSLKDGKFFKEFVFSTKNPEEVMSIITQKT